MEEPISETRLLLNTFCTITIYDTQNRKILAEALDLCAEYEAMLSISIEESDVWRINHAKGKPTIVESQTADIIRAGLEYSELSGGMFDITIGRLSTLWDFSGLSGVPVESDIDYARETVDYSQVTIDGNTVQLANPEAWIDLGGIAKGYIADRVADFLEESGVKAAIIDLGGNIVVLGKRLDGNPWKIGVTSPFNERRDLIGIIETSEASIVSAGVYERQFEENGVQYHHIIDPYTGMPVQSNVVGATVISEKSMVGDALSTISLLVGIKQISDSAKENEMTAESILESQPGFIGAVFVLDDGEVIQYGDIDFQKTG